MKIFPVLCAAFLCAPALIVSGPHFAAAKAPTLRKIAQTSPAPTKVMWPVRGANVQSRSPGDFGSASYDSTLYALHATGANAVKLIVDLNQATTRSSRIFRGPITPTDAAMTSGIEYAKRLGMAVTVAFHDDVVPPKGSTSSPWRANIDPTGSARVAWFKSYQRWVVHFAVLANRAGAVAETIGTEMNDMVGAKDKASWLIIIARIRSLAPTLKLYYEAWGDEYSSQIQSHSTRDDSAAFCSKLNAVGITMYPALEQPGQAYNPTFARDQYISWRSAEATPLDRECGEKPLYITEAGFSSAPGTLLTPPRYFGASTTASDLQQAEGYRALFAYWGPVKIAGLFLWEWSSNPTAGGPGDPNMTPQDKLAEGILRVFYGKTAVSNVWWPTNHATLSGVQTLKYDLPNWPLNSYQATYSVDSGPENPMYSVSTDPSHWEANIDTTTLAPGPHTVTFAANDGVGDTLTSSTQNVTVAPSIAQPAIDVSNPTSGDELDPSNLQQFTAVIDGMDPTGYTLYWQVDGGQLNLMQPVTLPSGQQVMQATVDVANFTWNGTGPYIIDFLARDTAGYDLALTHGISITVGS